MINHHRVNVDFAIVAVVATVPLVWIRIAQLGPLAIKPVHLALVLVVVAMLLSRSVSAGIHQYLRSSRPFLLFYSVYLLTMALALAWTDPVWMSFGTSQIAKQVIFAVFASLIGAYLVSLRKDKLVSSLVAGGIAAYIMVMFSAYVAYAEQGENAFVQYIGMVSTGNWAAINYQFFPTIFSGLTYDATYEVLATLKHDVSNGLFLGFALFQIGAQSLIRIRRLHAYAEVALMLTGLLMLLMLVSTFSRSTIVALLVAFAVVGSIRASEIGQRKIAAKNIVYLIVLISSIAAVWLALGSTVFDYALGETGSYDGRLSTYQLAMDSINDHVILGRGLGILTGSDAVHNFFLRSWYHAGLLALASAIVFYVYAMGHWIISVTRHIRNPDNWVLPLDAAWVFALPALPLVRTLITATDFILSQWICFAVYFAFLARNEVMRDNNDKLSRAGKFV